MVSFFLCVGHGLGEGHGVFLCLILCYGGNSIRIR